MSRYASLSIADSKYGNPSRPHSYLLIFLNEKKYRKYSVCLVYMVYITISFIMGIVAESKKLLDQFVDTLSEIEVRKQDIEQNSPHRIVGIDREIVRLESEVKKMHKDIDDDFQGLEVSQLKTYFEEPVSKAKILDYEAKLIELDNLRTAREQEVNSYYLKT